MGGQSDEGDERPHSRGQLVQHGVLNCLAATAMAPLSLANANPRGYVDGVHCSHAFGAGGIAPALDTSELMAALRAPESEV